MSRHERYCCTISRDESGRIIGVSLEVHDLEGGHRRVRVDGHRAAHIAGSLHNVLRPTGLRGQQWTATAPIDLEPVLGAHAELLVRAIKPLRRVDRISSIAEAVAGMSREEACYWHAQSVRRHGLKALRVLLDGGVRR